MFLSYTPIKASSNAAFFLMSAFLAFLSASAAPVKNLSKISLPKASDKITPPTQEQDE